MIQKVGIVGRGAVGGMFGSLFNAALGREKVCFIVDDERKRQYEQTPFLVNGKEILFTYETNADSFGKVDLLLIAVKGGALSQAMEEMQPFIKRDTVILSLINGISSENMLMERFGREKVIHAIAQKMDAVYIDQTVSFVHTGEMVIGTPDQQLVAKVQEVSAFLTQCAIPHVVSTDIIHDQWSKLMLNCGLNQVCAVYDVPYAGVKQAGPARDMFLKTMREVQEIAALEGVCLLDEEVETWDAVVSSLDDEAMPSMRQDVLAHRKTEVALFAETICALANKHHTSAPCNALLRDAILEREASF